MGYFTMFDISKNRPEVIKAICEHSGYDGFYVERKWYSRSDDMRAVSLIFPHEVIEVTGYGDTKGDIWRAYYKNGKEQTAEAKISFEEFDESKLE